MPDTGELDAPLLETEPVQVANLCALASAIEHEETLPDYVTEALEKALRSAGDDSSLAIEFSPQHGRTEPGK